ncbi:MAG: Fic family protein [Selenomonadaceae bacterium]|nr:Fic family protein [Selenomonadaceae bacterium]
MENNPPYKITDEMLSLTVAIEKKVHAATNMRFFMNKPYLRRNNRIQSIHSSLAIEANSLSLDNVRNVINGRAVIGPVKEIREVKNAYDAYEQLSAINPYNMNDLLKIHGVITKGLVLDSGAFRLGEEGVFSDGKCIFMAPPARLVRELMQNLFDWLKNSQNAVHPLILSSVFHYEFVFIHPFSDGNGRIARLWQTAILMRWEEIFQYIPIENQIYRFQNEYYKAISDSHAAGESSAFITFMLRMIEKVLTELLETSSDDSNPHVNRLLSVMEYQKSYTAKELLKLLGLKSLLGLRKNYLNPALKEQLIVMTEPDKPTSKRQRYRRT